MNAEPLRPAGDPPARSESHPDDPREALIASELRYRRLFETAKDGILILDAETGMVMDVNPFLIELLGLSYEQFLCKKVWELGFFKDILANEANFAELQQKGYVRYEDKPLETSDGRRIEVEFVSNVYLADHHKVIQCNIRDISARKRTERESQVTLLLLKITSGQNGLHGLIREATALLIGQFDCQSVGIRLRDGDDFPYFETRGFPAGFVEAENFLCERDAAGQLLRDSAGNPVLECMCGNILCGRFDPAKPFFTAHGSFWTNSTTQLLASTTEADRQARTRNRCNGEGYESVAIIPLRMGDTSIGLLQLNDKRQNRFTLDRIKLLERLADTLAVAIAHRLGVEKIQGQLSELQRWQDVMLGREGRVQELKREVNELCRRWGESVRYPSQEADSPASAAARPGP